MMPHWLPPQPGTEGVGGWMVYLCIGRHLVVVAAGTEKTRAVGDRGFLIYKDSPV